MGTAKALFSIYKEQVATSSTVGSVAFCFWFLMSQLLYYELAMDAVSQVTCLLC